MSDAYIPVSRANYLGRVVLSDLVWALIAPVAAGAVRDPGLFGTADMGVVSAYVLLSLPISLICFVHWKLGAIISRYFGLLDATRILKCSMAIVFATATISFVFFRLDSIPRSLPIIHLFILVSLLCAGRILTRTIKRKDGAVQHDPTTRRQERLILVGVNRLTWLYIQMLDQFGFSRHSVVGILGEGRLVGRQVCGRPVIGEPSMITNIIREYSLHGIDIA
ncbi:MAG: hypothetical protein JO331_10085, partial [Verrucomicrobia bacterium]|nr:hypothetical protein [Verrucomicrobiota bacterium]